MTSQHWPYPTFAEPAWLRGDGNDPALNAVRTAVLATMSARGQRVSTSDEALINGMAALADLDERIDWALLALVGEGRSRGMSWATLGKALGISKQAVQQRFGRWVAQAQSHGKAE